MNHEEQGQLAIRILADICGYFRVNKTMDWKEFMIIQEGRNKELDKVIKKSREKEGVERG